MKRRDLITLLGGAALSWPITAQAQRVDRVRRIGGLMPLAEDDPEMQSRVGAFQKALEELGWVVGQNVRIDYRWPVGDRERMRAYAAELVSLAPDVLLATNPPTLIALRQATSSIPIVFTNILDPLGTGVVESLARPGGSVTGFSSREDTMAGKWVELLKEVAPHALRVGLLLNPSNANPAELRTIETAASSSAVRLTTSFARTAAEIETAMLAFTREPHDGLFVLPDPLFTASRELIVGTAARHRWPAVYNVRAFVASGGLMSYGIDINDLYRRAGAYVDRILKGAKPGDLPVQQPTKFELVVNLKAAKAIGLTIPESFLLRADEVIE
jgi:putative ABC transport system substrate-binding protein